MRSRSLRHRVERAFAVLVGIALVLLAFAIIGSPRLGEGHVFQRLAKREAENFVEHWDDRARAPIAPPSDWRVAIGRAALPDHLRDAAARLRPGEHEVDVDGPEGRREYLFAVRSLPDRDQRLYLVRDVTEIEIPGRYDRFTAVLLLALVVPLVAGGAAFGRRLAQRMLRPLAELEAVVRSTPLEKLPGRLREVPAEGEVGILADALSSAMQRVRAHVEREQRFTRSASHELRTPVTVIKGAAELLDERISQDDARLRAPLDRIRRATADMEGVVEAFLWLAREESERPSQETCEVVPIVHRVVESHRHRLDDKPIEVRFDLAWELVVRAPATLLAITLGNLVANAFEHVDEGTVTIGTTREAAYVVDTGSGLVGTTAERLRRPFEHGSASQGHGLGLTIVDELCQRCGWTLSLANRGRSGTLARIELGASIVSSRPSGGVSSREGR